ncbi:NAD(P)/FAD-dependent oxidoreductase [Coralloluteibacterium thermophilus]|uniref:NAD(P)/FAD-dependent oxidoreductase n=1 Tax=Coralloluteibacterium thermophilum TaxID=2707049 RepID=A0ABV9NN22_9GAMM
MNHVVIVGGGVAGLELATRLGNRLGAQGKAQVTLVDRGAAHLWKPMLHTLAAGTGDGRLQRVPYLAHAAQHHFRFRPGPFTGLDRTRRRISLGAVRAEDGECLLPPQTLDYDLLVLALGSRADDFGTPGVAEYCHFIDSQAEAESFNQALRRLVLRALAGGATSEVAIVGGGATGVELAASLVQLVEQLGGYGARDLHGRVGITLIESGPRLLPAFPERVSAQVEARLGALGIRVRTRARVVAATPDAYVLDDGTRIRSTLKAWAAGVRGEAVPDGYDGLETSRNGRLLVRPTLQATRDDRVFAVGDCASLTLPGHDRPLAPTAQVAHRQARHLSRQLPRVLAGESPREFVHRDLGALVPLGHYDAFGTLGQLGLFRGFLHGRLAHVGHAMLYRRHQAGLHGIWSGSLLWLAELLQRRVRPALRLD